MDLAHLRATHVEVDLDRIRQNVTALRNLAQGAQLMAVVKADGYGHGAVPVAKEAIAAGATWLGVATVEEGIILRKAGLNVPILVLGYVANNQADLVVEHDLRPAIFNPDLADTLSRYGRALGRTVKVHLKVDTGMSRVGVQPADAVAFIRAIVAKPNIELEGVFTHLATADEPDNDYAARQLGRFAEVLEVLRANGINPPVVHACNSAGIMLHPQGHHNLVRAGIAMYGLAPDPAVSWPVDLKPALTWRTAVSMVKVVEPGTPISYGCTYWSKEREKIASMPVGYADGLFRLLSNKGEVLIHGHRCPIVGRVCMDQTMVRVPLDLEVKVGDEVILIGEQQGEQVSAADMARTVGTINYEVVCAIGKRVPRVYRKDGQRYLSGIL